MPIHEYTTVYCYKMLKLADVLLVLASIVLAEATEQ